MRLKLYRCIFAIWLLTVTSSLCTAQNSTNEKKASYYTIQVPGALGTYPMALNDSMVVTGYYMVSPSTARAFVQDASGAITTFSVPGSIWTEPESINADGDITGFFEIAIGAPQGFERYAGGRIVTFNPPCISCAPSPKSQPVAINDFGIIAGNYPFPLAASHGFIRSEGGALSQITLEGDDLGADYSTIVTGLNGSGTVVGYVPYSSKSFIWHPDGFTTWFSVPVAESHDCGNPYTIAESVNADGAIAGRFSGYSSLTPSGDCSTPLAGGFVRSPEGVFTLFNAPGPIVASPPSNEFYVSGLTSGPSLSLNEEGVLAGSYTDTNQVQHGFVREPDGVIFSFDPSKSRGTTATNINSSGVIVGYYYWNAPNPVGFVRTPTASN